MAWVAMPQFVAGQTVTAAQLNVLVGNLLETAPAKATTAGQIFVATGQNAIAARGVQSDAQSNAETTTSTSWTDLPTPGPQVTVGSGTAALALMQALCQNSTTGAASVGMELDGATTLAAGQTYIGIASGSPGGNVTAAGVRMFTGLTPGANRFTMKYIVGGGTGTFSRRYLTVIPF